MDPPTNLNGSWPEGIKRATQAIPVLEIDYRNYPQSAKNICENLPFIGCIVISKLAFVMLLQVIPDTVYYIMMYQDY